VGVTAQQYEAKEACQQEGDDGPPVEGGIHSAKHRANDVRDADARRQPAQQVRGPDLQRADRHCREQQARASLRPQKIVLQPDLHLSPAPLAQSWRSSYSPSMVTPLSSVLRRFVARCRRNLRRSLQMRTASTTKTTTARPSATANTFR